MTTPATPQEYARHYLEASCNDCLDSELRGESRPELVLELYGHLLRAHPHLEGMTFTVVTEQRGGLRLDDVAIYRAGLTDEQRGRLAAFDELIDRTAGTLTPALSQNRERGPGRSVRARPEGVVA